MASPEQKKLYQVSKDFRGINTKANRTAIGKDEFAWLENAMPIGFANIKIVSNSSNVTISNTAITWANTVIYLSSSNIGLNDYVVAFQENGSAQYYNITTGSQGNVAVAGTFSNAGIQASQWENERMLIIDPVKGYFTWDGTNVVSVGSIATVNITSGGGGYVTAPNVTISSTQQTGGVNATATATLVSNVVASITLTESGTGYINAANVTVTIEASPTGNNASANVSLFSQTGTAIQSFSGRVWIAEGRTIYYSAAGSYNDFTSVSAGNIILTDATLHGTIQQLLSANNFLYIFGDTSINVFSDVRVGTLGNTLFTNTNVSASVGSKLPYAIFPYFRSVLFMNNYGVYALVGATTTKLSDPLDGVIPDIDFTKPVYAGQVLINNILCAAFNFYYTGNGYGSSPYNNYITAIFFEKKWFFVQQGSDLKFVIGVPNEGLITMYGSNGTNLKEFFSDNLSNIDSVVQTALLAFDDPIRDKQALKIGVEVTSDFGTDLDVTVDAENRSSPVIDLTTFVNWQNINLQNIPWTNNLGNTIGWVNAGYFLYKNDAQQYGKYLGMTITAVSPNFTYNGMNFEYELRARY
jgi:hypothetical protein